MSAWSKTFTPASRALATSVRICSSSRASILMSPRMMLEAGWAVYETS
jgi:hypothetical protein